MTDITILLYGLVFVVTGLIIFVFRKYITPWIMTKMSASQWDTIVDWAMALVTFAEEKITGEKMGSVRFNRVLAKLRQLCNEHNYDFDDEQISAAIQYAWSTMIGKSDTDIVEYKPENTK